MGKPKFKSSMKYLQQALTNLRPQGPKTIDWICIQQPNTHSSRQLSDASSNDAFDFFHDHNQASSSSSSLYSNTSSQELEVASIISTRLQGNESSFTTLCRKAEYSEVVTQEEVELARKHGLISSRRFFFSPCTTNSIMEQPGVEEDVDDISAAENVSAFIRNSSTLTMEMTSDNPYEDFKESMEEMVEAHGVKDWSSLQELLHCYLSLNDKDSHDTIVTAFVDLLITLIHDEESITSTSFSSSNRTSSLSSSLSAYLSS